MGIRMDQWVGLPAEAIEFIFNNREEQKVITIVLDSQGNIVETNTHTRLSLSNDGEAVYGMFGTPAGYLREWTLSDGRTVREQVQAEPWSSGPMFFTQLVDDSGEILYAWTQEEIDREAGLS